MEVLVAWVGENDLKAAKGDAFAGEGPIARALKDRNFDEVVLLSNYEKRPGEVRAFHQWLGARTTAKLDLRHEKLSTPTDYADIHRVVTRVVPEVLAKTGKGTKLTFHLSPGTPAMASIWILVAAKYSARLIQSSKEGGVQDANIPFNIAAEFVPSLVMAEDEKLERLSAGPTPANPAFSDILHQSEAMQVVVHRARLAAPYRAPLLIEGASGTGKELFAAAIHRASKRTGAFVTLNCGAIPKNLLPSEFFDHKKGAFTGAYADSTGRFEQAQRGTLFLDEIGELPLEAQVKLLRVLQEKKVRKIGDQKEVAIDVRVIAATNRDLLREVGEGRFREDLYFRLATLSLRLPPLRDREGDILLLAERLLESICAEEGTRGQEKKLSAGAKNVLLRHPWPGNVRELHATLLRAYVWSKGTMLTEAELKDALVSQAKQTQAKILDLPIGSGFSLQRLMGEVAQHYLKRSLEEANGNRTKAADLIGLSNYQTLGNWLRKYGVEGE